MDWKNLGKTIAGKGATLLGGVLGGPGGAALGGMVAEALGLESDSPDEIAAAIERDPESALKLKEIESSERVRLRELSSNQAIAMVQEETKRQAMVNDTMKAEYKTEGLFKSGWRPFVGWVFGGSAFLLICSMIYAIAKDPSVVSNAEFTALLIWLFTAMAATLGINIRERSKGKRLQAGEAPEPGALEKLIKAAKS